jgi:hypothetical protein
MDQNVRLVLSDIARVEHLPADVGWTDFIIVNCDHAQAARVSQGEHGMVQLSQTRQHL